MPPKRRPSIGRSSSDARRLAALRLNETSEDREGRLVDKRKRAASSRDSETSEDRECRLVDMRTRAASSRDSETSEDREGRFRQTLPVIPRSTPADKLNACLKASYLWRHVKKMSLKTNMRVHLTGDASAGQFCNQLLTLGDGRAPVDSATGQITFPSDFCNVVNSKEELKAKVFPNIQLHFRNSDWLCERAILAPKNDSVNKLNFQIQNRLPGECRTYKSVDTVTDPAQSVLYTTEFLNSLEPPGLPPHNLLLKVGSPIMLLRNLDPPKLCNGTRLLVKNLFPNIIEATILTGCSKGEDVFIPRIPLIPSDLPFDFRQLQFPVRLAFAMSINKAQGQSLKVSGVDLENPCFSHGQLYVACSRVGTAQNLFIFAQEGKTKNIVYQKALE